MNMPRRLSDLIDDSLVRLLRGKMKRGEFGEMTLDQAILFLQSDGMTPESKASAQSFLDLEDWARALDHSKRRLTYTTTDLKNKTGEIVEQLLKGKTIQIQKHGRVIGELKPSASPDLSITFG